MLYAIAMGQIIKLAGNGDPRLTYVSRFDQKDMTYVSQQLSLLQ